MNVKHDRNDLLLIFTGRKIFGSSLSYAVSNSLLVERVLTQEVHSGQLQRLVTRGAARRLEHDRSVL